MLILAQDGLVEIEAGYEISKSTRSMYVGTKRDKSHGGFAVVEPVIVKGIVTNNKKEIPQIKAEEVAAGTRDEYLSDFGKDATIFRLMGIGFILTVNSEQ